MEEWYSGLLVKFILKGKYNTFINEELPLKINIPTFHYSMCEAKRICLDKLPSCEWVVEIPRCFINVVFPFFARTIIAQT